MALAESLFAMWMGLAVGQNAEVPMQWIAPEAGSVKIQKVSNAVTADGNRRSMAVAERVWDAHAGPAACQIRVTQTDYKWPVMVQKPNLSEQDVELYNMTHELGHCADRRAKPSAELTPLEQNTLDRQREAFANTFSACLMTKMGKSGLVFNIMDYLNPKGSRVPNMFASAQAEGMRKAQAHPLCRANVAQVSEVKDFEDAWQVAAEIDKVMFAQTQQVPFETFMAKRTMVAAAATKDTTAEKETLQLKNLQSPSVVSVAFVGDLVPPVRDSSNEVAAEKGANMVMVTSQKPSTTVVISKEESLDLDLSKSWSDDPDALHLKKKERSEAGAGLTGYVNSSL